MTENEPLCAVCGCSLADSFEPTWTEFGAKCSTCSSYRPTDEPTPTPDQTDEEEAEHDSAPLGQVIPFTRAIRVERRLRHAA